MRLGAGFFPTALIGPVFVDAERSARNAAQTCIGRNGDLSDIDGPLLFLCSQASAYVTGQVLMVDGCCTAIQTVIQPVWQVLNFHHIATVASAIRMRF